MGIENFNPNSEEYKQAEEFALGLNERKDAFDEVLEKDMTYQELLAANPEVKGLLYDISTDDLIMTSRVIDAFNAKYENNLPGGAFSKVRVRVANKGIDLSLGFRKYDSGELIVTDYADSVLGRLARPLKIKETLEDK